MARRFALVDSSGVDADALEQLGRGAPFCYSILGPEGPVEIQEQCHATPRPVCSVARGDSSFDPLLTCRPGWYIQWTEPEQIDRVVAVDLTLDDVHPADLLADPKAIANVNIASKGGDPISEFHLSIGGHQQRLLLHRNETGLGGVARLAPVDPLGLDPSADPLTGLPLRSLFFDHVSRHLNEIRGGTERAAVLVVDIDRLQTVNDSLGFSCGDQLVQGVAERLRSFAPHHVARFESDEFLVLLRGKDAAELGDRVQQLMDHVQVEFHLKDFPFRASITVGAALYPTHGKDAASLIKAAGIALHQSKAEGQNSTWRFFHSPTDASAGAALPRENGLRSAIEEGCLEVHYQGLVDPTDGRITSAEALVRWRNGDLLIPPDSFIPLAEDTGLIVPLGDHVLEQVCSSMRAWMDAGYAPLPVAVNLSPLQVRDPKLAGRIEETLARHQIEPSLLTLELTERSILDTNGTARDLLQRLHHHGVRFAIDDFGVGHSSFSYLADLPIHCIKIDRSFVSMMTEDRASAEIVKAIVALASALHLKVVAEGVETRDQLLYLRAYGCDAIQGFLLTRPIPETEFRATLRDRKVNMPG